MRREGQTDDGLYAAERAHPVPHEQRFLYGKAVRDYLRASGHRMNTTFDTARSMLDFMSTSLDTTAL
jgi:hypothetical protein